MRIEMLKKIVLAFAFGLGVAQAQVVTMDTTASGTKGTVTIGGYIDAYWGYDFNKPETGDRPYFVSMARHNEININLAYLDIKYTSSRVRARLVPGFGTYMNANYAIEPGTLKNIVEANAGVKLFKNKEIWIDAGVIGSPYSSESAISRDHLAYTRSFAPEYVPYYLSGMKLSIPLSSKLSVYLYVLNGWQQINDLNDSKSFGSQIEFKPNENWLINWNTYAGNERSDFNPSFRVRYFTDLYFVYNKEKWSVTSCVYAGSQKREGLDNGYWWQANLIGRYRVTDQVSVTGRVEYFNDPDQVMIEPITSVSGFSSGSSSLGINYQLTNNAMVRFEGRTFFSDRAVYSRNEQEVNNSSMVISNITVWF